MDGKRRKESKRGAFSLLELLVVLTVIGMLLAFAAPNLFSLVQSRTLSNEGILLRNQLTYAQQIAVSKNADVEVRFFKWIDEASAQTEPIFSAFQLYQYNDEGVLAPISSFFRIKAPTAINEELSTLLRPSGRTSLSDEKYGIIAPSDGSAPAPSGAYESDRMTEFVSFRFRPDGSTNLPNRAPSDDTWHITLVQGEGAAQTKSIPRNYYCLQVNPYNGAVTEFRP